ncbi:hypothetical protein LEP1GSC170_4572 [Leptospira interrogans serovar Bataviae str. HAI135]|nr:hypothetical protein LEP1GSC170_4572 [Leptospira interrogans serovar Bataviae str. HAI135]
MRRIYKSDSTIYPFSIEQRPRIFSFDGSINYTELQRNFRLPIYSVLGTLDKIVPVNSVEEELRALPSSNNQIVKFDQGHLGILFHMPTVREMCSGFHDWIQKLD